jgi:hypothetical protein
MKKNLIKEQSNSTPEVAGTNYQGHNTILTLVKQYCNIDVKGNYDWKKSVDGKEGLYRLVGNNLYNIISVNDKNQVVITKQSLDSKGVLLSSTSVLRDCNNILSDKRPSPITIPQSEYMKSMVSNDTTYQIERPSDEDIKSNKFKQYDMYDIDSPNHLVFPHKGIAFIYRQTNLSNQLIRQYPHIEDALKHANYTLQEPERTNEPYWNTRRPISKILGDSYKTYFEGGEPYVWVLAGKLGKGQFDSEKIKKECREAIKTLYDNFKKPDFPTIETAKDRIIIKNKVHYCKYNKKFAPGIIGLGNELETLYTKSEGLDTRTTNPYGMKGYNPTKRMNENKSNLSNLIRENLLEIKEKKTKSILSEGKIVKGRLSIISENVVLKTNKQKDKFFGDLLSEMVYLNSQGFDKQVINEGFFDMLKSLLGHSPEGIMEYFKEYMGEWLVKHLTPVDEDGWIGNMIITGIGNLDISEIPKLTDCNFLTKWISKTAAEGTVRKLTHEKGLDGPFYDVLRNSIIDMMDKSTLGSKIEEGLGGIICPLLGGVKSKMDAATDKLKEKALAK